MYLLYRVKVNTEGCWLGRMCAQVHVCRCARLHVYVHVCNQGAHVASASFTLFNVYEARLVSRKYMGLTCMGPGDKSPK